MLVAAGPLFAGCVDDGAAAGPPVASSSPVIDDDAATAAIVYGALKDQANAMALVANNTVADINDLDPDGRYGALHAGFDTAADQVREYATIVDDDTFGRVGQFFNSIEKVDSLVEPVIARYGRMEFQRAFLDEPLCEHVIQPFDIVAPTPASSDLVDAGA